MKKLNYLSLDFSILYRCSQKYFDKTLDEYGLGYAHVLFLTLIYENEGISMAELANYASFDKGTITKSIQKLQDNDYVRVVSDDIDKRRKLLYSTEKSHEIMSSIYLYKQKWWDYLCQDLTTDEANHLKTCLDKVLNRCLDYNELVENEDDIKFFGIQKLSLIDYPSLMSATLFTGGCNFRCPFCHNRDLVFLNESMHELSKEYILDFLNSRKNLLDGVCISGGEPLLNRGLKSFIIEIKKLGLKVKLDTNGSQFEKLKDLIDNKLIDYVALDIKNTLSNYPLTTNIDNLDTSNIIKTVDYLKTNVIDFEFRTTIVKEYHKAEDLIEIAKWLQGPYKYYLQSFKDSGSCIKDNLHSYDVDTMIKFKDLIKEYMPNVELRGID